MACNQSEGNTPAVMPYTLRVITFAYRRLHTNPSDWIKNKTVRRLSYFLSFVFEKELGENREFSQFIYHFNNSKNISTITAPETKPIIIELTTTKVLIHFCSISFLYRKSETAKYTNSEHNKIIERIMGIF